jgi:hypothetical protein
MHGIVLYGHTHYDEIRGAFNKSKFNESIRDRYLLAVNDEYTKLIGVVKEKYFLTAATMTRSLVEFALDAYLASLGDTYPRSKWRMRKLERNINRSRALFDDFCEIEFNAPYNDASAIFAWMGDALRLTQRLQAGIYFGKDFFDAIDTVTFTDSHAGLVTSPTLTVEKISNAFVFRLPYKQIAADPVTAATLLTYCVPRRDEDRVSLIKSRLDDRFDSRALKKRVSALVLSGFIIDQTSENRLGWVSV